MNKLKAPVLKILEKTYQKSALIEQRVGKLDLVFKTDSQGRPILLFLGRKDEMETSMANVMLED